MNAEKVENFKGFFPQNFMENSRLGYVSSVPYEKITH